MFRWWEDYANQISNNGIHYLDLIRWMLEEKAPVWITAGGGRYAVDDDRTIPDTMQATFEFASGTIVSINIVETSSGSFIPYGFIEMRGTKWNPSDRRERLPHYSNSSGTISDMEKLMDAESVNMEKENSELLNDGSYRKQYGKHGP
jgi:hypothetical protein